MIWVTLNRSACLCVFGLDVLDDSYAYMMYASLCVYVSISLELCLADGKVKIFESFLCFGFSVFCVQVWMEMKLFLGITVFCI